MKVGVVKETAPGETRVALVPETVSRVRSMDVEVLVESGAGQAAWFSDEAYAEAEASVVSAGDLREQADMLLRVRPPEPDEPLPRAGQAVVGLLEPLRQLDLVRALADAEVTAVSLDMLPRTLSRAQSMDALSSQANIAGYKAVLVAAGTYGRYLPLLMTAAGTTKPARLLVLGVGVAGLQALGTARRLGAVTTAYDVRPATRAEVESVGAQFLDLGVGLESGAGEGGYARALSEEEQAAQQQALDERIAEFDIVITTAQVPGRRPPVLVSERALAGLRPGSVVVDLAASALGGNVVGSEPEATKVIGGVTVIGAGNLPATMPAGASTAYARNLAALLGHLVRDGALAVDLDDEIQAGVVVTHGGAVTNSVVAKALGEPIPAGGAG